MGSDGFVTPKPLKPNAHFNPNLTLTEYLVYPTNHAQR